MKKLFLLMIVALALLFGTCWGAGTTQAKEISVFSRGNIIYQQDGMEAALYAEDLLLLKNKLSTIPENNFDPGCYIHESGFDKEDDSDPVLIYREFRNKQTTNGEEQAEIVDISDLTDASEENPTETEESEDTSAPTSPSEENSSVEKDEEDTSVPTDPSEENSSVEEDKEDTSVPVDPSEENSSVEENEEDASASVDPSEGNSLVDEDPEDTSASAAPSAENPSETESAQFLPEPPAESLPKIGDVGEQILSEE